MPLYYPVLPFGFLQSQSVSLVDGSDGDLVVVNGQTVQITAGSIKSYNSIDIQVGGVLEIIGAEAITQIGCRNDFICNGVFKGQTNENVALRSLGADNWLGLPFSHTQVQSAGGKGGNSFGSQGVGGSQSNGFAGGGGGFSEGVQPCSKASGGNGQSNGGNTTTYADQFGVCQASPHTTFGGLGNQGGHGQAGSATNSNASHAAAAAASSGGNGGGGGGGAGLVSNFVFKASNDWNGGNGGAGGGARGEHGRHVFILAENGISGTGSINFNGNVGYNGGGATFFANSGGGGGGAGGSGGAIWLRHSGIVTPTIISNSGGGGARSPLNIGGVFGYYYQANGNDPQNGAAGSSGILDVQAI